MSPVSKRACGPCTLGFYKTAREQAYSNWLVLAAKQAFALLIEKPF